MTYQHYERFIGNSLPKSRELDDNPIYECEDLPILTLEEAIEPIIELVPEIFDYVSEAKANCNQSSTLLTLDESAAIYLYSMPIPFYSCLKGALQAESRYELKPWFPYLKLFLMALRKLPSIEGTIWRGVNYDATSKLVDNDVYTYWDINSCSTNRPSIQAFLGEKDTLLTIETIHGKDISMFAATGNEHEVILMPETHVRVKCLHLNFIDRLRVVYLQEVDFGGESQPKLNSLFEKTKKMYQQNSRIKFLMNPSKSVPIEQSYINLSIVEAKEQDEKERLLYNAQHRSGIMSTFEVIYGLENPINIEDIFNICTKEKKQVIVFGRAGIGKSTLCQHIAYQWATDSAWSHYKLLALIPLRCLTSDRYPPLPPGQCYSLIDLVKQEVFLFDLSESEERLFTEEFDPNKILWILDGYDEIIPNVPPHLKCLFEQLLQTPQHIVTSRPYLNNFSYEVQVRITGFTIQNIEKYVQQFFKQQNNDPEHDSIKSETLLNFLQSNPSIHGVAHIPRNLELICSLWNNNYWSQAELLTMTTMYTAMLAWLCRQYLITRDNQILQVSDDEIEQCCQKELAFLSRLAFCAMESNTVILQSSLLEKVLEETNISSGDFRHVLALGILKSFRQQGIETQTEINNDHYFVHLSLQEYFAARYLANTLKSSPTAETIRFLQRQKYNQRYALVFAFTFGLLSQRGAEQSLNVFWNIILDEPLDIVGIRHIQLVISCIEEISTKSTFLRRTELLEWISRCIKYSFIMESKIIRQHLLRSLQKAQTVVCQEIIINGLIELLKDDDEQTKAEVLRFISELGISNPPDNLITLMTTLLDEENENVQTNACKALGKLGRKVRTNEVIGKLVTVLGDESASVREEACRVLVETGGKMEANVVISHLLNALNDDDEYVKENVCQILGNLGENAATNEVIDKLVNTLKDEEEIVRANACQALGKIGKIAATSEVISELMSVLDDKDKNVRVNACRALGDIDEKLVTNELIDRLVTALHDKDDDVRWSACKALGEIGGKVAKQEIIRQLTNALDEMNEGVKAYAYRVLEDLGIKSPVDRIFSNILLLTSGDLGSQPLSTPLSPTQTLDRCTSGYGSICFEDLSFDELMKVFLNTKGRNYLTAIVDCVLQKGIALTVTENSIVVYNEDEPLELAAPNFQRLQQLIEVFTDQAKQLQLYHPISATARCR